MVRYLGIRRQAPNVANDRSTALSASGGNPASIADTRFWQFDSHSSYCEPATLRVRLRVDIPPKKSDRAEKGFTRSARFPLEDERFHCSLLSWMPLDAFASTSLATKSRNSYAPQRRVAGCAQTRP